jgi:ribosomal protein S27AE
MGNRHADILRQIQNKRAAQHVGQDVKLVDPSNRMNAWVSVENQNGQFNDGESILSKQSYCPACDQGILLTMRGSSWIPQDRCPNCGAGKPFLYRGEK